MHLPKLQQCRLQPPPFCIPHHPIRIRSISHRRLELKLYRTSGTPLVASLSLPGRKFNLTPARVSEIGTPSWSTRVEDETFGASMEFEDLVPEGEVYRKTLRLVECSMFAAVSGIAYFLSNSLAIENRLTSFFALPIVVTSLRWGIAAGRKTMVATAMLLLVLSGPVKALSYLLMHGLVGFAMGSMWRLKAGWGLSIILCTFVRAVGALGYVLISSFLIRENILALITVNIHAYVTYFFTCLGISAVPSMGTIYAMFGTLLLLNCCFKICILHLLYAILFSKTGLKEASLRLPRWLEMAL